MDELVQACDFLSLHTTLTAETRNLIGAAAAREGASPGIRIVNAARGELVDEKALLAALESGRVAGRRPRRPRQEPPVDWRLAQHPQRGGHAAHRRARPRRRRSAWAPTSRSRCATS